MKKFYFRFTPLVWVLLTLVLIFSVGGLIFNTLTLIRSFTHQTSRIVLNSFLTAFNLFLVAFTISVIVYSRYVIKDGCVFIRFGFIRSKIKIEDVVRFSHFKKSNKLVMYFKSAEYTVIIISPEEYESFILAVRDINQRIIYDVQIDGEETP